MKLVSFIRLVLFLLSIVALTMIIPLIVAFAYGEVSVYGAFLIPILSCIFLCISCSAN